MNSGQWTVNSEQGTGDRGQSSTIATPPFCSWAMPYVKTLESVRSSIVFASIASGADGLGGVESCNVSLSGCFSCVANVDFFRNTIGTDTELFAGTIRDNIARFRNDVPDEDVIRAAKLAGVHELILRLPAGYETQVGESGHTLSAGQRQRVGLARTMLGSPAFIVLDEPNASLDAEGENALLAALDSMKANGATVVIISHKPSIFRAADKMLVLREGRVELFGPRDQVMSRLMKPAEVRAVEAGC